MFDTPLTPEALLDGTLDVDAIAASIPPSYIVKGMFCTRLAEVLGAEYGALERALKMPARGGRYVAFKDYPQADYTRLAVAAATKRFPRLSLREAVRRIARDDLATFADSMIGKVALALVGDARGALLRTPDSYARVAPGPVVRAEDLDDRTVRLVFEGYRGIIEYSIGQIEGIVLAYKRPPTVTVRKLATDRLGFDVVHAG